MKARITEKGYLQIERAGRFATQCCPFSAPKSLCGDWCPLFGEVSVWMVEDEALSPGFYLPLCKKTLLLDEVEDLRDVKGKT